MITVLLANDPLDFDMFWDLMSEYIGAYLEIFLGETRKNAGQNHYKRCYMEAECHALSDLSEKQMRTEHLLVGEKRERASALFDDQ